MTIYSSVVRFTRVGVLAALGTSGALHAQTAKPQAPAALPAAGQTSSLPTPAPITPNGTVVEDVVVRVNDQIISRSDLERSQQQLQGELQQQNVSPADREQREKDLLRDMVDQQLLLSRGKELGLNADAEVIRRLDEIRKQNHLESMEDLEKAARQQGVSFEDFKAQIKNGIITQQVVRDEVGRRLQMTQGQEQTFYDAHKEEFARPEQVRLSEILIPTPADANDATVAQAQKKAEDVAAKLSAGGKFEDLAKQYSGGPTAAQGGELGLFKRGALAKVLEDQTFSLNSGQNTAPIRTRQGFVILKVTDHQQAGIPTMKEVEPQIQEAMYMQQMQPALRAYLTKLREAAYIDIKPGFVDTGASSKQTKPVFTAYSAPVPKKKKAEQKQRFDRGATKAPAPPAELGNLGRMSQLSGESAPAATATPAPAGTSEAAATAAPATVAKDSETSSPTAAPAKGRLGEQTLAKNGKPKKIRREKVRFGQAPRNSLLPGPQENSTGADTGAGAASAAVTPGGTMEQGAAAAASGVTPGQAIAPINGTTQISSTSDPDPLAPKVESTGKTRFSSRSKEVHLDNIFTKDKKAQEKKTAMAAPAGADEVAAQKTQAAPLGLNGDTASKKKKIKVKGAPKERLQGKKPETPEAAPIAPTVNPSLNAAPGGTSAPPVDQNPSTLPPVTAPAPGAPAGGQPLPPSGSPTLNPNGTTAPPTTPPSTTPQ